MVLMKNKLVTIINLLILVLLSTINVVFISKNGINNDSLIMLVFAIIFILLYIFGMLFPNIIVKFIHSISLKLYKNSENISVPVFTEAKRRFIRRLIYILIYCNICLFISWLTYLF